MGIYFISVDFYFYFFFKLADIGLPVDSSNLLVSGTSDRNNNCLAQTASSNP